MIFLIKNRVKGLPFLISLGFCHNTHFSQKIFRRSRQITPKKILLALIQKNHSFTTLVKEVQKAPSTVSTYVSKLIEDNLVFSEYENSKKIFKINPEIQDQLIYTLKISI